MFLRSIRFRLTIWFALTLAVIMAASGLFWHNQMKRNLLGHIDERLVLIAENISSFHTYYHTPNPGHDMCPPLRELIDSNRWGAYVQVVDAAGDISCSTANMQGLILPIDKETLQQAGRGQATFRTVKHLTPQPLRLLSHPIREQGRVVEIVQVGETLAPMEETLAHMRQELLVFSPLLVLGLSICGWFLAGRALDPVVRMTEAIHKIGAEDLNQQLPVPASGHELAELARTFNDMLARLANAFDRNRQFTGDASHELRTPLAILKGETEVALRWAKDPEELRSTLVSNMEEIDRMGRIIDNLLSLAKSEAGDARLTLSDFSLTDMMQDLYLQGNTLGETKNISVSLQLAIEGEVYLRADQMQIHRALLNLVSNAVKYTQEGGHVDLGLALADGHAIISVRDNGFGIPEKHLPHIFERFYRVDEARNRAVGGTGLGLALVQATVKSHRGTIEVVSSPGIGSTFTVRLPLQGPPLDDKKKMLPLGH